MWAGRTRFAEYAEAVGVPTDHIMGAMETDGGSAIILYSLGVDDDAEVRRALYARDEGGVLRRVSDAPAGTLREIMAQVEGVMLGNEEQA